ncbi:hypothetical protein CMO93_05300 [Candidatus Woesearchaeota archaeon]|nr:hypothetical protein [Candidatus Woesearchaeota archaeon]|tara:strand:+ start:21918 stop:22829 length:912 start_codon:yes stop_codon:yes gene_type:complete
MKHTLKITLLLLSIFFITQVIGLAITKEYISIKEFVDPETNIVTKEIIIEDLPYNVERPEIEGPSAILYIFFAILIGTILLLILIKFKKISLWKLWFFLAVFSTMAIAFSAFIPQTIAAILAFILAILKIYKPTTITQNLTEIFIYGGLAAIFVPIINIFAAFMLLLIISIYDIIAVRHTKHMVTMAKFQTKSKVFTGLMIPYQKNEIQTTKTKEIKGKGAKLAVLGGGDIGFPLIFAGVVMKNLMLTNPEIIGFLKTLIIPFFVTLALLFLLFKAKQDKFYPAMPYLTIGCIIGYLVVLLLF